MSKRTAYRDVNVRLGSFKRGFILDPTEMSDSGFFLREGETVECFSCALQLSDWIEDHVADVEHLLHSPCCRFMKKKLDSANSKEQAHVNLILSLLLEQKKMKKTIHDLEETLVVVTKKMKKSIATMEEKVNMVQEKLAATQSCTKELWERGRKPEVKERKPEVKEPIYDEPDCSTHRKRRRRSTRN